MKHGSKFETGNINILFEYSFRIHTSDHTNLQSQSTFSIQEKLVFFQIPDQPIFVLAWFKKRNKILYTRRIK